MKNIQKYIQYYHQLSEESFAKWGYYSPPRSWEDFERGNEKKYQKYLKDETDFRDSREGYYLDLFDDSIEFGFLQAFEPLDFTVLNDVLYQTGKHKILADSMLDAGTDHAINLENILSLFACNHFEMTEVFFPKELPLSKGCFYTEVCANLLRVMYYKLDNEADLALSLAQTHLEKKNNTVWTKSLVEFFIALHKKNSEDINDALVNLCKGYTQRGFPVRRLDKCFAQEIHGLYRLIRYVDKSLFQHINMPKRACFLADFESWQAQNTYPKGQLFYTYPKNIDYINTILQADILPVNVVYGKKNFFLDTEQFKQNLGEQSRLLDKKK